MDFLSLKLCKFLLFVIITSNLFHRALQIKSAEDKRQHSLHDIYSLCKMPGN